MALCIVGHPTPSLLVFICPWCLAGFLPLEGRQIWGKRLICPTGKAEICCTLLLGWRHGHGRQTPSLCFLFWGNPCCLVDFLPPRGQIGGKSPNLPPQGRQKVCTPFFGVGRGLVHGEPTPPVGFIYFFIYPWSLVGFLPPPSGEAYWGEPPICP